MVFISREEVYSMNNNDFRGVNADYLEQYVQLKRSLGYQYDAQRAVLLIFDRFTIENKIGIIGLNRDLAFEWSQKRPNESESFRYNRIRYVSGFSSFLNDLGIKSFIPRFRKPPKTFVPYIFSHEEMIRFFKACDSLVLKQTNWTSSIISVPAIFRLLYGTGLRISEVVALNDKDVNLTESYLIVRDSKNGQERMVPMMQSLVNVLNEYVLHRNRLPYGKKDDHFFVTLNGSRCISGAIRNMFSRLLENASIPYLGRGKGPRLHDIRHTFAVHSLVEMAESGIDLYTSLPILSTYLGHQLLESTNDYVRLTSEMYPGLLKDVDMITLNVFPNIINHENE